MLDGVRQEDDKFSGMREPQQDGNDLSCAISNTITERGGLTQIHQQWFDRFSQKTE